MHKHKGTRQSVKRELRTFTASSPMEAPTLADGTKQISGHAIVFNSDSVDMGFIEQVKPGALTRTLRENTDILAMRDHTPSLLLGRTTAGTLSLRVDNKGLAFTITLPNTAIGQDTYENVRNKNLTGVSFGFKTIKDSWVEGPDGIVRRFLEDIDLYEISPTSFAAYPAATVSTRSAPAAIRAELTRSEDDDFDDDNDIDCDDPGNEDTPECQEDGDRSASACRCERCVFGEHTRCYNERCEDASCRSAGCPAPTQDDPRADSLRIRRLFAHRVAAN